MKGEGYTGGLPFEEGERAQPLEEIKPPDPAEAEIQKAITKLLDLRGIVYAVTNSKTVETEDGPRQLVYPPGWPDITALMPITGQLWAIEVKTLKGKLREAQEDMLALIEASGGRVTIARDSLQIRDILNEHIAKFQPDKLFQYMQVIRHLKRVYQEHAALRALKRKAAKWKRRLAR